MRVLFNCIGLKPLFYEKGGAIQKIISHHISYLKQKHNIIVIGQIAKNIANIKLIPYEEIPHLSSIRNFIYHGGLGFLKMKKIDADLVISTHQRNFLPSFLYAKFKGKPMIAWELDHEFWVPPITKVKRLYHYLVDKTNIVIAISSVQKRRMVSYGVEPEKIILLYNCIDTRKYSPLEGKVGEKDTDNYILYVAKFAERKNHLSLLKAFKKVVDECGDVYPDLKLYLVGPSTGAFTSKSKEESSYYRKCLDYIHKHLEGRVNLFEDMTDDELINLYQNALLFVFPSLEEGFGMTLLEAMSCGCPCVSYNIEPQSEILGDAGYIVKDNSVDQLANAIIILLKNNRLKEKLRKLGRKRAVSMFDIEVIGRQLEYLIENIKVEE